MINPTGALYSRRFEPGEQSSSLTGTSLLFKRVKSLSQDGNLWSLLQGLICALTKACLDD